MKERIKKAFPNRKDIIPVGIAVIAALAAKIPEYAIQGVVTVSIYELFKSNPELIPLGISTYALFTAIDFFLGYQNLIRIGAHAGLKSSGLMIAMNMVSPNHRRLNAFLAQSGSTILNIAGATNPVAIAANISALNSQDPTVFLAHRSSVSVSRAVGLAANTGLLLYKKIHG